MPESIFSMSGELLHEAVTFTPEQRVLLLSAADAGLVRDLRGETDHLSVYDPSYRALHRLQATLQRLGVPPVTFNFTPYPDADLNADAAIVIDPPAREIGRAMLWMSYHAVRPGGSVYLAGANSAGIKTLEDELKLIAGHIETVDYRRKHRLTRVERQPEPAAYPPLWGPLPLEFTYQPVNGLEIAGLVGVSGWKKFDPPARRMIDVIAALPITGHVLDLGSGTGLLGALAAARATRVTLTDDELLAVRCSAETLTRNGITNAAALTSDVYSALSGQRFQFILCHPPADDPETGIRMIQQAPDHLLPDGRLILAAPLRHRYDQSLTAAFKSLRVVDQTAHVKIIDGRV